MSKRDEFRERIQNACANRKIETAVVAVREAGRETCLSVDAAGTVSSSDNAAALSLPASCMIKIMTAIVVMRTCGERKVSLDADVADVLASVRKNGDFRGLKGIRLRHLLNHSHGLDDVSLAPYARLDNGRLDLDALCARFVAEPRLHDPGRMFSYSDAGALLAGAVIEGLQGKNYGEILRETLLPELRALSADASMSAEPNVCPTSGGALEMTARDYLGLAAYLCRPDIRATMLAEPIPMSGWTTMGRGSCLGLHSYDGGWYGYNATTVGGGSVLLRFHPESDASIVILCKGPQAYQLLMEVFGKQLPECSQLRPPRMLTETEARNVDTSAFLGKYVTATLSAEIETSSAEQLQITIRNRSDDAAYLKQPIQRGIRLAESNVFFTTPVEASFFAFGQFLTTPSSPTYLWNGRRVWRKVA